MKTKYDTNLLELWLKAKGVVLEKEYKFCESRRWRADYVIPLWKVLIEVEGGYCTGRHMRIGGFLKDMEKYNMATILGYHLFRIDSATFKKTQALDVLQMWYEERQSNR